MCDYDDLPFIYTIVYTMSSNIIDLIGVEISLKCEIFMTVPPAERKSV